MLLRCPTATCLARKSYNRQFSFGSALIITCHKSAMRRSCTPTFAFLSVRMPSSDSGSRKQNWTAAHFSANGEKAAVNTDHNCAVPTLMLISRRPIAIRLLSCSNGSAPRQPSQEFPMSSISVLKSIDRWTGVTGLFSYFSVENIPPLFQTLALHPLPVRVQRLFV